MLVKELKEFLNNNPQYDDYTITKYYDSAIYYSQCDTILSNEKYKILSFDYNIENKAVDEPYVNILKRQQNTYLIYATCDHDTWWFFVKGYSSNDAFNYLKQIVENVESSEEMIKKLMCSYYPNIVRYAYVPNSIRFGTKKFEIGDNSPRSWLAHFRILQGTEKVKIKTLEHVMSFIELNNLKIKDLKFNEDEVWFEVEPIDKIPVQAEETKDKKLKKKR